MIFLDYDGTLIDFNFDPEESIPDDDLKQILQRLSEDKKNKVVIISGRDKETLDKWLSEFDVDIVAEHGAWMRCSGGKFETLANIDDNWKKEILDIMESYVDRTPGSFIENKNCSVVWHYRKVETGLSEIRTRELISHMKYITTNKHLQIIEGDKVLEVKTFEINKGKAASAILDKTEVDFILSCGDDATDEDTFLAIPEDSFTVKVGSTASVAKYSVASYEVIRKLLSRLIEN